MKKVLAVLAVAGLASSAMAQSFEARIGMRTDHGATSTPNFPSPHLEVNSTNALNLQALFGAFAAAGFDNRGMFNFIGTITVSDPASAATIRPLAPSPLRFPYNFGGIYSPNPAADVTTITFDANRSTGSVDVMWEEGGPSPAEWYAYPAGQGGPNSYFNGLRFILNPGSLAERDITITVSGPMQAINGWFVTGGGEGEMTSLLPGGFVTAQASASFVVRVIPAPGALALLGLGGLVATRRRR